MWSLEDTICAVASASGGAARGIVRMSGPAVAEVLSRCFHSSRLNELHAVRIASVIPGAIQMPPPLGNLPGQLFYWPTERSYTGQPAAEFHTLGAEPLLSAVVRALCQHGARPAEPGEFTLRAFLAGRIDLTQAEAVLGVIDADSTSHLAAALAQLAGGISQPLGQLREELLQLLAHLEAGLDFAEEGIEFISTSELEASLANSCSQVEHLLLQLGERTAINQRPKVVLAGAPNVGKSSLYNALVGQASAMVSTVPGTTRDYLSAQLNLNGIECELYDTAGLSTEPQSVIDGMAQQSSVALLRMADIVLACSDQFTTDDVCGPAGSATVIRVLTKCDNAGDTSAVADDWVTTSSVTGQGLERLTKRLREELARLSGESPVAGTAERCYDSLRLALSSLQNARTLNDVRAGEELLAAEIRIALNELGKVVGAVYTDDILDRVFARFCIGK